MAKGGPPAHDGTVNGGANWAYGPVADPEGIDYVPVNARLDKDGQPTGKVHWRQTRGEDQDYRNWVGDVIGIFGNKLGNRIARLSVQTKGGDLFRVHIVDNGEPGAGVDRAWLAVVPSSAPGPVTIENGNYQVSREPRVV